jgi:hypothetical protein
MSQINFFIFAGFWIYASFYPRIYRLYNMERAVKVDEIHPRWMRFSRVRMRFSPAV